MDCYDWATRKTLYNWGACFLTTYPDFLFPGCSQSSPSPLDHRPLQLFSRLAAPGASIRFWRQAQAATGRGSPKTLMEKSLQVDRAARWEVSAPQHSSETGNSEVTWFIRWNTWPLILSDSSLPWHLSLLRLISMNQVCFSLLGFVSVNHACLFYVTDPMLTACCGAGGDSQGQDEKDQLLWTIISRRA